MQSDIVQCSLCAKLSPNMEQTAARTAAQIGCTMQCRECGRTYETQAAEITRLTEALRAAEEREKGLREALKPFAKCCEDWISDDEDDEEWAKFRLLIKDYRRASVAMKEQGHDG